MRLVTISTPSISLPPIHDVKSKIKKAFQEGISYIANSVSKLSGISKLSNLALKIIKLVAIVFGEEQFPVLILLKQPLKAIKNSTSVFKLADKAHDVVSLNAQTPAIRVAHKVTSFGTSILKTVKIGGSLGLIDLGACAAKIGKVPVLGIISKLPLGIVINVFQFAVNVLGAIEDALDFFSFEKKESSNQFRLNKWNQRNQALDEMLKFVKKEAELRQLKQTAVQQAYAKQNPKGDDLLGVQAVTEIAIPKAVKIKNQELQAQKLQNFPLSQKQERLAAPIIDMPLSESAAVTPAKKIDFDKELKRAEPVNQKDYQALLEPKAAPVIVGQMMAQGGSQALYNRFDLDQMGLFEKEKQNFSVTDKTQSRGNETAPKFDAQAKQQAPQTKNEIDAIAEDVFNIMPKKKGTVLLDDLEKLPNLHEIDFQNPKTIFNAGEPMFEEIKYGLKTPQAIVNITNEDVPQKDLKIDPRTLLEEVIEPRNEPQQNLPEPKNVEQTIEEPVKDIAQPILEEQPLIEPFKDAVGQPPEKIKQKDVPVPLVVEKVKIEETKEIKDLQKVVDMQRHDFEAKRNSLKEHYYAKVAEVKKRLEAIKPENEVDHNAIQKLNAKVIQWEKIIYALERGDEELLGEVALQFKFKIGEKKKTFEILKEAKVQKVFSFIYRVAKVVLAASSIFLFFTGIGIPAVLAGFIVLSILTYSFGVFKFFWSETHKIPDIIK